MEIFQLKNLEDSFSYALGLNIANNLIKQGIDKISNAAMQRAMDDVFNKKPYLMNEQQSSTCIQEKIQGSMAKKNELVKRLLNYNCLFLPNFKTVLTFKKYKA